VALKQQLNNVVENQQKQATLKTDAIDRAKKTIDAAKKAAKSPPK
jgi:hypothetical protein